MLAAAAGAKRVAAATWHGIGGTATVRTATIATPNAARYGRRYRATWRYASSVTSGYGASGVTVGYIKQMHCYFTVAALQRCC